MIKTFPGNVIVKHDMYSEKVNGVILLDKNKLKKNKGKIVIEGEKTKKGDAVLFFPRSGVRMDEQSLIEEKDVILIFKKNGMKVLGDRLIIEAELAPETTDGGILVSEAHRPELPIGRIVEIGDDISNANIVLAYNEKAKVLFDKDRATPLDRYSIQGLNKHCFMCKSMDVLSIL